MTQETNPAKTDERLQYPATSRNRDAILDVLRGILPTTGLVLEIASGSGEHVIHFAQALPQLTFQPSDPEEAARKSIAAWTKDHGLANIRPPLMVDAASQDWPIQTANAVLCINMIHISPWRATEGLMRESGRILSTGAPLYLYGAYRQNNVETVASNEAFDANLKQRNPEWGLRHLEDVSALAKDSGFSEPQIIAMPANNLSVVFRKL